MKQSIICALVAMFLVTSCATQKTIQTTQELTLKQNPKREFRGAWIQTAYQDEYQNKTEEQFKRNLIIKLDYLKECGINAVIFQVRPEADAFYKSNIEPWSRFYTGVQGKAPQSDFDPLQFMVEECHNRNMELHAWLNPYRAATNASIALAPDHIYYKYPERFVIYNNQILFDPGVPQNRQYICSVVKDIVSRYDIDAIHMDDYFYPYPHEGQDFPDEQSFAKYAVHFSIAQKDSWRRNNVNTLIQELRNTIVSTKPWVRFGISPFGIYRNHKNTADGSGSFSNGLQNYDDLYADVMLWARNGWIDYIIPQIYWECRHTAADYVTLINWWDYNTKGTHLYIGQDVNRTMKNDDLVEKMWYQRLLPNNKGNCFWPANEIIANNGGIGNILKEEYHKTPALIPAYTNQHPYPPKAVKKLKAEWTAEGYILSWQKTDSYESPEEAQYYVIYRFDGKEKVDISNSSKIVGTTREATYKLPYDEGTEKYIYAITAVDRFHNESEPKTRKVTL